MQLSKNFALSELTHSDTATAVGLSLLHRPYRWGGDKPANGFDCSGLVIEMLQSVGVLPAGDWTSQGLYSLFLARGCQLQLEAEEGCLVFFGKSVTQITHVGYALNSDLMLEAGGGDATTTSEARAIEQDARVRVRPIARRKDLVGILNPFGELK